MVHDGDTPIKPNVPHKAQEMCIRDRDGGSDATRQAVEAERQRNSDIVALCRQVGMDPAEHIRSGHTIDQVRQAAVDFMIANGGPVATRTDDGQGNEFRNAAVDALLLRAGVPVSNPAREAESLRGMSAVSYTHLDVYKRQEEAMRMTQAYLSAILFGRPPAELEQGDE